MSQHLSKSQLPSDAELENLFVNNAELTVLRALLNRFNPIKTMGMERMEIRHSAILAWLLNPQETHGLGDAFLKAFLCQALKGSSSSKLPSALDVAMADLMDAEVRREWRNIDLLVLSQRNQWAFVIENKFDSTQHSGQLTRYMDRVESTFVAGGNFRVALGLLLTLRDETAKDERYVHLRYADICELLEPLVLSGSQALTLEVEIFLKHYLQIIKEATGMSEELDEKKALARRLYQSNRKVLDFIVKHGTGTGFTSAVETLTGSTDPEYGRIFSVNDFRLRFGDYNQNLMSFHPFSWITAIGGENTKWEGCRRFPLVCCLKLFPDGEGASGSLQLTAEITSISNQEFRTALVQDISDIELPMVKMPRGSERPSKGYKNFLTKSDVHIADISDMSEIRDKMAQLLHKFRPVSDQVALILPKYVRYGVSVGEP